MKTIVMKTRHCKFHPLIFGIGYWKDVYMTPFNGYTYNVLLPFFRIQWGVLNIDKPEDKD